MKRGVLRGLGAIAAMALAALALGCGGGEETSAALSKAQFVKKGNAICKEGENKRIEAMFALEGSASKAPGSEAKLQEEALLVSLPPYEKTVEKLSELGAPEGDEEKVEGFISAMETAAEQAKADPKKTLTSNVAVFRKANRQLEAYGLDECDLIGAGSA